MTCFWINSRPFGNLEDSTVFGSLIKGIFLIAFLESGKVHLRIFGRDSPAQIMHAEVPRDFARNSTGKVLQLFQPTLYTQSSADFSVSFLQTALRGDWRRSLVFWNACGVLLRFSRFTIDSCGTEDSAAFWPKLCMHHFAANFANRF